MSAALIADQEHGRRRSSDSSRRGGHGRGGAGNAGPSGPPLQSSDLETPTIKSDVYTTGRGGSGNMAKYSDAEDARRAQDVASLPHRDPVSDTHVGRGGAANVVKLSSDEIAAARRENALLEKQITRQITNEMERRPLTHEGEEGGHESKIKNETLGLAEKGKKWLLGLGKN